MSLRIVKCNIANYGVFVCLFFVSILCRIQEMKTEDTELANAPAPLSLDELAPPPNMDDIFGRLK